MKVRIGVGLGAEGDPATFGDIVDQLETAGIDSLWLSEIVFSRQVEPFVGMANALGRTRKLKVGTGVAVLPGRHPVLVAKQLASLAGLAPGRVLPAFGLQPARPAERQVFAVPKGRRAAAFDEAMRLLRLLLTEDEVTFHGEFHDVERVSVGPRPAKPLDIWLGGSAPAALDRIGRLADGWLGSFLSPEQARRAREAIQAAADAAGREIEPDHFGLSLAVATDGVPQALIESARRRHPDADPAELIGHGWQHARELLERHIEAGLTKFVIRPAGPVTSYTEFLDHFTGELLPLQN
jgi:probable F420-dependent oxidoreductase